MLFSEVTRKQAFLTHLSISLFIFFVLSYLIVFEWYPSYYMSIDGGYRGLATIFFVDVVLGPGLTLLVFKQGKKGLKFDLSMIVLLQVAALSWGINSVYTSRPALTVFYEGRFACISNDEIKPAVLEGLGGRQTGEPLLAFLRRPDTFDEYLAFSKAAYLEESSEIYFYTERFEPINDSSKQRINSYQLNVEEAIKKIAVTRERNQSIWNAYKKDNPDSEGVLYFPLLCRYKQGLAVYDKEQGKIIDYVDFYVARAKSSIELKLTKGSIE